MTGPATVLNLNEGWTYALTDAHGGDTGEVKVGEWTAVKQFPTTVHVELLKEGKIPDPVRFLVPQRPSHSL